MQGAPVRLRCQYESDPLGIGQRRPSLSWWSGDDRPAELQTAYHLLAASDPERLARDEGDLWDSGRVEGRQSSRIDYQGEALQSGARVCWKVRSFDSDGLPSPWSEPAIFELGLLEPSDWDGRWIGAGLRGSRISPAPVPLFGRDFELPGDVIAARLYLAVRGLLAVQVNGETLLDGALLPGWVDFRRRTEALTLDVTHRLRPGGNGLAVLLADGWYAGDPGNGRRHPYGERPEFLLQLNATLADGTLFRLATDSGWRWQPSWILAGDPGRGEQADAMRRSGNWLGDGTDAFGWYPVVQGARAGDAGLPPTPVTRPATISHQVLHGELVYWQADQGCALFEFPEPVLGRARLAAQCRTGDVVRLRYGLSLGEGGQLAALGEDAWVAAGEAPEETFAGRFSLHGFRYVEVSGDMDREDSMRLEALPIARTQPAAATLVADHPRLNRLFDLLLGHLQRTQNVIAMAGLAPGDRVGRTADVAPSMGARVLTLDGIPSILRWLRDMADAQLPEGGFPALVPALPEPATASAEAPAGSSAAFVDALWQVYRCTGDRSVLHTHFDVVKRMLAGGVLASRNLIREDLPADPVYPMDLAATAWFYRSTRLASRIAGVLGKLSELEDFEELAGNVRNAFRRRFVTPDGRVLGDNAAVYALTLGLGLLDRSEARRARPILVREVLTGLKSGGAAAAALLATPRLLPVLSEQGRLDLAYRLVLEVPLRPDPEEGGRDLGRLLGAGVLEWLFGTLSGLSPGRDLSAERIAFRHALVQPRPPLGLARGETTGEPPLREVESALATQSGCFESSWRITDDALEVRLRVPGNCSADVVLPDGTTHAVDAGSHEFRMPFGEAGDGIPVLREVS